MSVINPETAIVDLVARTRRAATSNDPATLRRVYGEMLEKLHVPPDELGAWADGTDVVGAAYEDLLSREQRRKAGQFFTPMWAGRLMAGWLMQEPPKVLLDPGCGSAALLIAAAEHPKSGATRLIGTDIDPLAIAMTRRNALLRGITKLEAYEANFLLDEPRVAPDGLIVNPPYSRHHHIDPHVKSLVHDDFENRLGLKLSRRAGLHTLFLIRALEISSANARLAFIAPSDWLDVNYGIKAKAFLLKHASVEAIVLFDREKLFFEGTQTAVAITLIRKGVTGKSTKILRLGRDLPAHEQVLATLSGGHSQQLESVDLGKAERWRYPATKKREGLRLGDVARVRRGIATGMNEFFVISETERLQIGLQETDLRHCITSPRQFAVDVLTKRVLKALPDDVPRWVINCHDPHAEKAVDALGVYLRRGRRVFKANKTYLASHRTLWYGIEHRGNCPILFSYFNNKRPRFVRNRSGAVPLNNWLIIEPLPGVHPDNLHEVLSDELVTKGLSLNSRTYGGGLWKLEPSELADIILPRDPR